MTTSTLTPLQRPEAHEIEQKADSFFNWVIPPSWIRNPLPSDYGKDYLVEIGEQGSKDVKGNAFHVQLKGTASPSYTKDGKYICHTLQYKHLHYISEEVKIPLFLVVVDTVTQKGYWLFMQEYLSDPKNKAWKKQGSFTVRIPLENAIADDTTWRPQIERAIKQMRAKVVSIAEKFRYEIEQIEKTDSRFTAVPHGAGLWLVPKEQVTITYQTAKNDPAVFDKFMRWIDGEPVTFGAGEIQVIGSPLWDRLFEQGGTLQITRKAECTVAAVVYDSENKEAARIGDIRGHWEGMRRLAFKSERRMPFSFELGPIDKPKTEGMQHTTSQFKIDLNQWYDRPLLQLPYFDYIDPLIAAMVKYKRLSLEFSHEGNRLVSMHSGIADASVFESYSWFMEHIRKARHVARVRGLAPLCLKADFLNEEKLREIEIAYGILVDKAFVYDDPSRELVLKFTLPKTVLKEHTLDIMNKSHHLFMPLAYDLTLPFLGTEIPIDGQLGIELVGARIAMPADVFQKKMDDPNSDIKVRYSCSEKDAKAILRYIADGEPTDKGFIGIN